MKKTLYNGMQCGTSNRHINRCNSCNQFQYERLSTSQQCVVTHSASVFFSLFTVLMHWMRHFVFVREAEGDRNGAVITN